MVEETKHDLLLKRVQITIAILAGIATLILGVYNVKKYVFTETSPGAFVAYVRSDAGQPLARAHVELLNAQNAMVAASETKKDGSYSKKDLDPGSYILKISADGFEPEVATVQVNSKKTADFEIILRAIKVTQAPPSQQPGSPIKSALEEVGASWIKNLAKTESPGPTKKE